jgi:hypothetical protein
MLIFISPLLFVLHEFTVLIMKELELGDAEYFTIPVFLGFGSVLVRRRSNVALFEL